MTQESAFKYIDWKNVSYYNDLEKILQERYPDFNKKAHIFRAITTAKAIILKGHPHDVRINDHVKAIFNKADDILWDLTQLLSDYSYAEKCAAETSKAVSKYFDDLQKSAGVFVSEEQEVAQSGASSSFAAATAKEGVSRREENVSDNVKQLRENLGAFIKTAREINGLKSKVETSLGYASRNIAEARLTLGS